MDTDEHGWGEEMQPRRHGDTEARLLVGGWI